MSPNLNPEDIYSQFINQVTDYAIFATDNDGIITFWNEGAHRLKGYTEDEIIGQFFGILFTEEDRARGLPHEELRVAREKGVYEGEGPRRKKDGSLFHAKVSLTAIFGPDGKQLGFTKVTGDITKKKELEEEIKRRNEDLIQQKAELEKTNIDLDNFIYTASHDLKAPIANIEGLIEMLKQDLTTKKLLDESSTTLLQHVTISVERFKKTIMDLTEVSKIQKDFKESQKKESINVERIYEEVMSDSGFMFYESPCEVTTDFKVKEILFSRKNFRSILYNLLSNSFKYQSPSRPCKIAVKTYEEGDHVLLCVKDNGLGLSDKNLSHLYTMFKRFHDHVEGTGIGLYIVKRIVENEGGRIEVVTKENDGTEFKIYFKKEEVIVPA
jgi:PAS domain S-box-containing protein